MQFLKNVYGLWIKHPTKGFKQVKSISKRGRQFKITFTDWDWWYVTKLPTGLMKVFLRRKLELQLLNLDSK